MKQLYTLQTSKQKLQELNNLQTTIIGDMHRELQMLLTITMKYANFTQKGALGMLTSGQKHAVLNIGNRMDKLVSLVEQMTTINTAQKTTSTHQPLLSTDIYRDFLELWWDKANQAGLTLIVHSPPISSHILGDKAQLQQALTCLIDNAFKFTPEGGKIELTITTDEDWLSITVSDTGVGIAPHELKNIFKPFYQIDNSFTRFYEGLGLGLALVNTIIEAHRGEIEVESNPKQGSRFTIKLPLIVPAILPTTKKKSVCVID